VRQVNVAALEGSLGQNLADGRAKAGVIVGDDELNAVKAAPAQAGEEVLPRGAAFPIGHRDGQDLAAPVPVDADGDQHGLAHHHAASRTFS
jgi:hypothetical protein